MVKITMVMASTVDGKITRGESANVGAWTSNEDKKHFGSLIDKAKVIIMGAATYEAYRGKFKFDEGKRRIVITRNPKKYQQEAINGRLEFTAETPLKLISRLQQSGVGYILLTGGGVINRLFLQDKLVNDIFLTVEPRLFGLGRMIVDQSALDIKLQLIQMTRLNPKGSILLHYEVLP